MVMKRYPRQEKNIPYYAYGAISRMWMKIPEFTFLSRKRQKLINTKNTGDFPALKILLVSIVFPSVAVAFLSKLPLKMLQEILTLIYA